MRSIHRAPHWLPLLLLLAFGLRLVGGTSYSDAALQDDHKDYHVIAANLVNGVGYVQVVEFAYGRQPAWPYLLAGAYLIGGAHTMVGVWLTALLGTLTVALTWRVGGEMGAWLSPPTRHKALMRLPALVGAAAAVIVVFDPFLIAQDQSLLAESLYTCGVTLLLWLMLRPPTRRNHVLVGAVIGLLTLARSNGITFLLSVALQRQRWAWRGLLAMGVALIAVLAPWMLRNWAVIGSPTPLAPQTGQLLLGCYNEFTFNTPDAAALWLYPRELPEGRPYAALPYLEREQAWAALAVANIRANLAAVPRLMGQRLARWLLQPVFLSRPLLDPRLLSAQPIFLLLLLIGSLTGAAFLVMERRWQLLWLLATLVLPGAITVAALYGEARFRVPYHPVLACLTAVFIGRLATLKRG
jgi:hypothetical protein